MASTNFPGDQRQKSDNPTDEDYNRKFQDDDFETRIKNTPSQDDVQKGIQDLEKNANGGSNSDESIRDEEESGGAGSDANWNQQYTGSRTKDAISKVKLIRKISIFGGAGGLIGALLFFLSGFIPIGGLVINLGETATANRDTQNSILTKRLNAVVKSKLAGDGTTCADMAQFVCRAKMPSNIFLSRLDDYGFKAFYADGSAVEKSITGFPSERPATYQFTKKDGSVVSKSAAELVDTISGDVELNKAYTSALNMRYWGYADSWIKRLFYKPFGIDRTGKTTASIDPKDPNKIISTVAQEADKNNTVKSATDAASKDAAARAAITEAINDEVQQTAKKIGNKIGSPVTAAGSLVCAAINIPGIFVKVVRAYQMRQEIVLAGAIVLTASSMIKTGEVQPEMVAAIGTLLTATSILPDGTKTKSAMDSFAIKNILFGDPSSTSDSYKKFIPGYKAMQANAGITTFASDPAVRSTCAAVSSPQAEITESAIELGIGAAAGGVGAIVVAAVKAILKGVIAVGAVTLLIEAAEPLVLAAIENFIAAIPPEELAAALGNTDIEAAVEEDAGNVIGPGLAYFFSNACLRTGCGVLTTDQLSENSALMKETQLAYAEQDRFGRNPFDISSPYTFAGSIVSNFYRTSYVPGNVLGTISSSVGSILTKPFSLLNTSTYAAVDDIAARCQNAGAFGVDYSDSPYIDSVPGVGAFGEACTGIPAKYLDISTSELINSVSDQINPTTGELKDDSEAKAFYDDCSQNDLTKFSTCVIEDQNRANESIIMYETRLIDLADGKNTDVDPVETTPAAGGGANTGRPEGAIDAGGGWSMPNNADWSATPCDPRTEDAGPYTNPDYGFTVRLCVVNLQSSGDSYNGSNSISSVISTNAMNMLEAANAAGIPLGISDGMRKTGAGSYSQHKYGLAMDLGTPGGNTFCFGGDPQYGYGSLEAAEAICAGFGGVQYQAYKWLQANAGNYGFLNWEVEPWHWSTSGL